MPRLRVKCYTLATILALICLVDGEALTAEQSKKSGHQDAYIPSHLDSLLLNAYKRDSAQLLDSFFGMWERESEPVARTQIQPMDDTLKAVYSLFNCFYTLDSQYVKCKYVVLQDSITFCILDSSRFNQEGLLNGGKDALLDSPARVRTELFRPEISRSRGVLHLGQTYLHALNYFFNEDDGRNPCFKKSLDEKSWHDVRDKESFLKVCLPLQANERCIGFHFLSIPSVLKIAFTTDLSKARLEFRDSSEGSTTFEYTRTGTGWSQIGNVTIRGY